MVVFYAYRLYIVLDAAIAGIAGIFDTFLFQFSKFPLSAYSKWVQVLLTFVLPVGFISFYPSLHFFQDDKPIPFFEGLVYAPPVMPPCCAG